MPTNRQPNHRLAALMEQASVTHKRLAARVRAESQGKIPCDHTYVKRWLDGTRPGDETIHCIAVVLGTKLGRVLTFEDLGFPLARTGLVADALHEGAYYATDFLRAVDLLDGLTGADQAEGAAVTNSTWSASAVPGIITGFLFSDPAWNDAAMLAGSGLATAARIRATVRNLTQLDFQYGGGHTRTMLLVYWRANILPALRRSYDEPARREIFAAAADAAEVLGWSAYDAGRHGAAQRYFVQGLHLAREAGDAVMGAHILSNLSHQANYLGNFNEAVHLARAAQTAGAGKASATVNTMFLTMEARALASLGEARACADVLHRAELEFSRRRVEDDPDWISYFDELELAGETAHCFRDLGRAQQTQTFAIRAIDPLLTPARTRSFISKVHADGLLLAGDLDEALSRAAESIELAGSLQSSRYRQYLTDFYANVVSRGHRDHPSVRQFAELMRESESTS